jgi:hypothetical protein
MSLRALGSVYKTGLALKACETAAIVAGSQTGARAILTYPSPVFLRAFSAKRILKRIPRPRRLSLG